MRKTYRGKLPDADKRGYVRPEVGGYRFTVGNVRIASQGEMKRRRGVKLSVLFFASFAPWRETFQGPSVIAIKLGMTDQLLVAASFEDDTDAGPIRFLHHWQTIGITVCIGSDLPADITQRR